MLSSQYCLALLSVLACCLASSAISISHLGAITPVRATTATLLTISGGGSDSKASRNVAGFRNGPAETALFSSPTSLAISEDNRRLFIADLFDYTVRVYDRVNNSLSTLAGTGRIGSQDGNAVEASFVHLESIVYSAKVLYVIDSPSHRVRAINADESSNQLGRTTTIAGSLVAGFNDAKGTAAAFSSPIGCALLGPTTLLVSDSGNARIRSVNLVDATVTTIAGTSTKGSQDGALGTGTLQTPSQIALSPDQSALFVLDVNLIRKLELSTGRLSTIKLTYNAPASDPYLSTLYLPPDFASSQRAILASFTQVNSVNMNTGVVTNLVNPANYFGSTDGSGSEASFALPTGMLAIPLDANSDSASNSTSGTSSRQQLLICDRFNARIRSIDLSSPDYRVTPFLGGGTVNSSRGLKDSTGLDSTFNTATASVLDSESNYLFIAENYNNRIRRLDVQTSQVTTVAGGGKSGFESGSDSGPAASSTFRGLTALALHSDQLYIADGSAQIRVLDLTRQFVTTAVGNGTKSSIDGTMQSQPQPEPLVDSARGSNSPPAAPASTPSSSATVDTVSDMILNSDGSILYFLDVAANRVRRYNTASRVVSTVCGSQSGSSGQVSSGQTLGSNTDETRFSGAFQDGPCDQAQFNFPTGLALSHDEKLLFVADSANHAVRVIDLAASIVSTLAGSRTGIRGYKDSSLTDSLFDFPFKLRLAPKGINESLLIVSDQGKFGGYGSTLLRGIHLDSLVVETLVGFVDGAVSDGIDAAAQFGQIVALAVTSQPLSDSYAAPDAKQSQLTVFVNDIGAQAVRAVMLSGGQRRVTQPTPEVESNGHGDAADRLNSTVSDSPANNSTQQGEGVSNGSGQVIPAIVSSGGLADGQSRTELSSGVLAGIILGAILGSCILSLCLFAAFKRRHAKENKYDANESSRTILPPTESPPFISNQSAPEASGASAPLTAANSLRQFRSRASSPGVPGQPIGGASLSRAAGGAPAREARNSPNQESHSPAVASLAASQAAASLRHHPHPPNGSNASAESQQHHHASNVAGLAQSPLPPAAPVPLAAALSASSHSRSLSHSYSASHSLAQTPLKDQRHTPLRPLSSAQATQYGSAVATASPHNAPQQNIQVRTPPNSVSQPRVDRQVQQLHLTAPPSYSQAGLSLSPPFAQVQNGASSGYASALHPSSLARSFVDPSAHGPVVQTETDMAMDPGSLRQKRHSASAPPHGQEYNPRREGEAPLADRESPPHASISQPAQGAPAPSVVNASAHDASGQGQFHPVGLSAEDETPGPVPLPPRSPLGQAPGSGTFAPTSSAQGHAPRHSISQTKPRPWPQEMQMSQQQTPEQEDIEPGEQLQLQDQKHLDQ